MIKITRLGILLMIIGALVVCGDRILGHVKSKI